MSYNLTHAEHVAVTLSGVSRFPIKTQDLRMAEAAIVTLKELGWASPEGQCISAGTADVLRERGRQIEAGHDSMHDDAHNSGDLIWNALECGNYAVGYYVPLPGMSWGLGEKYAEDRRRLLVIASALLIAEIERMDRETGA